MLIKCINGSTSHTASGSKFETLPSRGGTVCTNRDRENTNIFRPNKKLRIDGIRKLREVHLGEGIH